MVSEDFAQFQIERLDATQDYQWKTDQARAELIRTLMANAESDDHARAAINLWIAEEQHCPTPADLLTVLDGCRPVRALVGCATCRNMGYVMIYQLGTLGNNDKWTFEDISREVYENLKPKLPNNTVDARYSHARQFVMEAARKCGCRP